MDLKTKLQEMKNKGKLYGMLAASVLGIGAYGLGQHNANPKGEERLKEAVESVEVEKNAIQESMQAEKESIKESMQEQIDELNNSLNTYSTYVEENERLSKENNELKESLESAEAIVKQQDNNQEDVKEKDNICLLDKADISESLKDSIRGAGEDTMHAIVDPYQYLEVIEKQEDKEDKKAIHCFDIQEAIDEAQSCGKKQLTIILNCDELQQERCVLIPKGMEVVVIKDKAKQKDSNPTIDFSNNIQLGGLVDIIVEEGATLGVNGVDFIHNHTSENYEILKGTSGSSILLKNCYTNGKVHTDDGDLACQTVNAHEILCNGNGEFKANLLTADKIQTDRTDNTEVHTKISNSNVFRTILKGDCAQLDTFNDELYGIELRDGSRVKATKLYGYGGIQLKSGSTFNVDYLEIKKSDSNEEFKISTDFSSNLNIDIIKLCEDDFNKKSEWIHNLVLMQIDGEPDNNWIIASKNEEIATLYAVYMGTGQCIVDEVVGATIQDHNGNRINTVLDALIEEQERQEQENTDLIVENNIGQAGVHGLDRE